MAWLLFCWNDMKWITLSAPRGEITSSTPALLTMPGCRPANHWLAHSCPGPPTWPVNHSLAWGVGGACAGTLWAMLLLTWATWGSPEVGQMDGHATRCIICRWTPGPLALCLESELQLYEKLNRNLLTWQLLLILGVCGRSVLLCWVKFYNPEVVFATKQTS